MTLRQASNTQNNILKIKVKIPKSHYKYFRFVGMKRIKPVYFCGSVIGDNFFSPNKPGSKSRRLYPVADQFPVTDILEWEVVKIIY